MPVHSGAKLFKMDDELGTILNNEIFVIFEPTVIAKKGVSEAERILRKEPNGLGSCFPLKNSE